MAYSREVALHICELIATGKTLDSICEMDGMPAASTFRSWVMDDIDGISAVSARAYEMGCHAIASQALAIADDGRNDWMVDNDPDNPGYKLNGEHVQRSKLRIETRIRLIGKWLPKAYGDKVQTEVTGAGGKDLVPALQPADVARELAFILAKAAAEKDANGT